MENITTVQKIAEKALRVVGNIKGALQELSVKGAEVPKGANSDNLRELIAGLPDKNTAETLDALVSRRITHIERDVDKIGDYTFRDCVALESVSFPKAEQVGYRSFYGCLALVSVNLPMAETVDNYIFEMCTSLPTISLPLVNAVTNYMFQDCQSLVWADLPKAASIGTYGFNRCYSLKRLILRSETVCTVANSNAFTKCYHLLGTVNADYNPGGLKDCYIYVPSALIDEYKVASIWSTHAAQFRALEEYTVDGTITGKLDENKI